MQGPQGRAVRVVLLVWWVARLDCSTGTRPTEPELTGVCWENLLRWLIARVMTTTLGAVSSPH